MTRARGRGHHGAPNPSIPGKQGTPEQYLEAATGETQREAHAEQLEAQHAAGAGLEPGHEVRPEPRDFGAAWDRVLPGIPRVAPMRGPAETRAYGRGDRAGIPGGIQHNDANPPSIPQAVPVPDDLDDFRGMMAHGVPPQEVGEYHREMQPHARHPYHPEFAGEEAKITPVPVYVVQGGAGGKPRARCAFRHITAPAAGSPPVPISGQNLDQSLVQLLNENSSHNCRVGELSDLQWDSQNSVVTGGARVPSGATGYTVLRTQSPLFVVSEDSTAVILSVIQEYEVADAG